MPPPTSVRRKSPRPSDDSTTREHSAMSESNSHLAPDRASSSEAENKSERVRQKLKKTSIAGLSQREEGAATKDMSGDSEKAPADISKSDVEMSQDSDKRSLRKTPSIQDIIADRKAELASKESDQRMLKRSREPSVASGSEADESENGGRGRLRKKRSFEEADPESAAEESVWKPGRHTRKRSRDMAPAKSMTTGTEHDSSSKPQHVEHERTENADEKTTSIETNGADLARSTTPAGSDDSMGESKREALASPKNKRNRDQLGEDAQEKEAATAPETPVEEPKPKRHRDSNSPPLRAEEDKPAAPDAQKKEGSTAKIPPSSGFANASAVSPFGALAGSKSPTSQPKTSASAFAASGFGALASSSTSPFGTLGGSHKPASPFGALAATSKSSSGFGTPLSASSSSGFGSSTASTTTANTAAPASGFGQLGGRSTFGSALGGGFGALGGGRLSSFADPKAVGITGLSDKPAKPFGATEDGDDEHEGSEDGSEEGESKPLAADETKKDKRFYEQEVETGEEQESTLFNCRAKLYNFVKISEEKKEWKERGLGTLKLNVQNQTAKEFKNEAPKKARFVMRADGSHRVVLNTPIQKELKYGNPNGERPSGSYFHFWGTIDNNTKLELLQLKMRQNFTEELYHKIDTLKKEM